MVDWIYVVKNTLWVIGLSLVLATFSLALYTASDQHKKLNEVLKLIGYNNALYLGMILSSIGICALAGIWWERLVWGVLALTSIISLWIDIHKRNTLSDG